MERFEKLIKQYYIPDAQVEVLTLIYLLSHKMIARTESITMRYGITRPQFNILNILNHMHPEPATIVLLKERTLVEKSDVSRIVMRLHKAGLVESTVNQTDKRAADVVISEKGKALFEQLVKHRDELLVPFTALNEEEVAQLRTYVRKLLLKLEEAEAL